ncbi:MAG: AarF/UbiB family protein, partial [Gammaproteobacteria bacterium]|nr:AarF/UbiB family protein [Gammaproteobacteria bacterium]
MWWDALTNSRDLARMHEIASVLLRYGFDDIVFRLGMARALERAGRLLKRQHSAERTALTSPERLTEALHALGPTFIKLGQILATRVDIFAPEWIRAFETLQDRVPAVDFQVLLEQLRSDFGADPHTVFAHLDSQPLAAASLAQVHRAQLQDGTAIVLKIRRPGVREAIEADLRLLERLAEFAEHEVPESRRYQPRQIVAQFSVSLRRELDFAMECRSAERIAAQFGVEDAIVIPKVYWQWTSERVNVQQHILGIHGRDLNAVDAAGLDRKLLARRGAEAVLKMVLEHGFFHADPHPGNVFYLPDNRLALIDFGMVGHLSDTRRGEVVDLLWGLMQRDTRRILDVVQDWTEDAGAIENSTRLVQDIELFLDRYHGLPLQRLDLASMLRDLAALMRSHQLTLPADLAILFKALITLDGFGRMLDPDFDIVGNTTPFLQRLLWRRYTPENLLKRGYSEVSETVQAMQHVPQELRRLLRNLRRGSLQINLDMRRLDHFGHQVDRAASRLTVGLVTA